MENSILAEPVSINQKLIEFVGSIKYVKPRILNGILMTVRDIPPLQKDKERLQKYVDNSLMHEGVAQHEIDAIFKWIIQNMENITKSTKKE